METPYTLEALLQYFAVDEKRQAALIEAELLPPASDALPAEALAEIEGLLRLMQDFGLDTDSLGLIRQLRRQVLQLQQEVQQLRHLQRQHQRRLRLRWSRIDADF